MYVRALRRLNITCMGQDRPFRPAIVLLPDMDRFCGVHCTHDACDLNSNVKGCRQEDAWCSTLRAGTRLAVRSRVAGPAFWNMSMWILV